jgi:hypothetical protein
MKALPLPANLPWIRLQTELRDLAFVLDRQGNPTAADVASMIAARIDELITDNASQPFAAAQALRN